MELKDARADVDGWLDEVKLKTGKCSELMRNEIAEGMRQRTISAFSVYDEIGQMEGSDPPRRSGTKAAQPLMHELNGLMHKHYEKHPRFQTLSLILRTIGNGAAIGRSVIELRTRFGTAVMPGRPRTRSFSVAIRHGTARIR